MNQIVLMETMKQKNISKREFLRRCTLCTGGLALGAYKSNCSSYLLTEEEKKIVEGGNKNDFR
ncbi:MAG: hypothetical protein ABR936_00530 [Bacteroidota bacterium]